MDRKNFNSQRRNNFNRFNRRLRARKGIGRGGARRGGFPERGRRAKNTMMSQRGNNNQYKNNNGIHFSYEKLKEINNKDDNEIIQFFMNFNDLSKTFENTRFNDDILDLMAELLMKISKINSVPASNILYQILKNTNFNDMSKERLLNEEYDDENYLNFLLNLILLNDKLIDKFTDNLIRIKYGVIESYVDSIEGMINNNKYGNNLNLAKIVLQNMKKLKDKEKHLNIIEIERLQKERENESERKYNINLNNIPIDYQERDIYLTSNDLNENEQLEIAPHIKFGSYISYERYINTMFYLEYQDCYKDLKETINYLQLNKSINKMNKKELYE